MLDDIIDATANGATSVAGGGDTVALLNSIAGSEEKLSHVSTGGGASLELVEGKQLPGVIALSEKWFKQYRQKISKYFPNLSKTTKNKNFW